MWQDKINLDDMDVLFPEAVKLVQETQKASASLIQRVLKTGYARSARLLDEMETVGIIGPVDGSSPREVFIDKEGNLKESAPKKNSWISDKNGLRKHSNYIRANALLIEQTLESFGITVRVAEINNRKNDIEFCLDIALGTRISDILALEKDLSLVLAKQVEIEAPIPGRSLIAIRISYPDYKKMKDIKPTYGKEEKKSEEKDFRISDYDNLWKKIRWFFGFGFYLLSQLFGKFADFIYPERRGTDL